MSSSLSPWTVCVTGVSGSERVKGSLGVGKSLLCNRFVRGHHDDFFLDHSSTLSQTDFSGSPVINNDHWLYWGERVVEEGGTPILVRVIEQTEFLDDETFEAITGPSWEGYEKRCARTKLESRDKLMYIRQEQLGTEADYHQKILPDGKTNVDSFIFVFDMSIVPRRNFDKQAELAVAILNQLLKSKRPVVIAATKFDAVDEGARRALAKIMSRKTFRDIPVVEVSALRNVNVDEVFVCSIRPKTKGRIRSFEVALKGVEAMERDTDVAYSSLLHALVSSDRWPSQRTPWARLVGEMGLSRNPSFCAFVSIFGMVAAKEAFEGHVLEVREECMKTRLRALLPTLPSVFASLLERSEVVELEWEEAKERIYGHALFDAFFLPLGTLGRLLEPVSSQEDLLSKPDSRFPAEILLRTEARMAFERWRDNVEADLRRERLQEEVEKFLASCPLVTPGRPLSEVRVLLAGSPSVFDALSPAQAAVVYDRFQADLVSRAESELAECLLEHVELFVEMVVSRKESLGGQPIILGVHEMNDLRTVLQEDIRYRQLSGVWERRDAMVREWAAFLSLPFARRCPATFKCIDTVANTFVHDFISRRRQLQEDHERVHLTVYGQEALVRMFLIEMQRAQMSGSLHAHIGWLQLRCREGKEDNEGERGDMSTRVFLVESRSSLERIKEKLQKEHGREDAPSSLFLISCPEEDYHQIPLLQQETAQVAHSVGGYMVSGRPGAESSSGSVDSPSPFPRSHLVSVAETALEAIERRRRFLRAQMSVLCADVCTPEQLLSSLLCTPSFSLLSRATPFDSAVVPLLTHNASLRVDLRVSSYHSWLCTRPSLPIHAHIVVYSAKRAASWGHARAAVRRILEEGDDSLTGRSILIVAVANDVTDYFRHEETNVLLTEGAELAVSVGAQFVSIPGEGGGHSAASSQLASFFQRVSSMVPHSVRSATCTLERRPTVSSSEGGNGRIEEEKERRPSQSMTEATTLEAKTKSVQMPTAKQAVARLRRPAPPRVFLSRYSIVAASTAAVAPLATPEPLLDVASEYSTLQDYGGSSEEDYAVIASRKHSVTSSLSEKAAPIDSPPSKGVTVSTGGSSSCSSAKGTLSSTASSSILSTSLSFFSGGSPLLRRRENGGKKSAPSLLVPSHQLLSTRSVTMDVISSDVVARARSKMRGKTVRHSVSVESLEEKKDKQGYSFVRALKSSFRKKSRDPSGGSPVKEKKEGREGAVSLPQSPALGGVRRIEEKKNTLPFPSTTITGSEKSWASAGLSWLAGRSPHRRRKDRGVESGRGESPPSACLSSLPVDEETDVPSYVVNAIRVIEKEGGLSSEGLYRLSGSKSQQEELQQRLAQGMALSSSSSSSTSSTSVDVYSVAVALKNFFARLPEPVIPLDVQDEMLAATDIRAMNEALKDIPEENKRVLRFLLQHLDKVAASPSTAMTHANLAIVWLPALLQPHFKDLQSLTNGVEAYKSTVRVFLSEWRNILPPPQDVSSL